MTYRTDSYYMDAPVQQRRCESVQDAPMGPKTVQSTLLPAEEEVAIVAFHKYTLLPLND
jgi:hypothetical protein